MELIILLFFNTDRHFLLTNIKVLLNSDFHHLKINSRYIKNSLHYWLDKKNLGYTYKTFEKYFSSCRTVLSLHSILCYAVRVLFPKCFLTPLWFKSQLLDRDNFRLLVEDESLSHCDILKFSFKSLWFYFVQNTFCDNLNNNIWPRKEDCQFSSPALINSWWFLQVSVSMHKIEIVQLEIKLLQMMNPVEYFPKWQKLKITLYWSSAL